MRGRGASTGVGRALVAAWAVALAAGLAGCGTASDPSPPVGVDTLVIPTPTPDPEDFVDRIDNQWLPLEPGAARVYEQTGVVAGQVEVRVFDETRRVAGVETTVVETRRPARLVVDYYAQDRDGNVWWFGREGEWEAGVDGARAGLAMAESPRLGDGYRLALLDGVVEDQARVVSVDGDVVQIETRSPLVPGVRTLQSYAAGVGLVRSQSLEGPAENLELVDGP